jgi:hypothetical protein
LDGLNYNRNNFYKHTFCEFTEVALTNKLEIHHKSKSGSQYSFTKEGVYRISNHWGRASNCRWRLISGFNNPNQKVRIGFAKWSDFYPNNETEHLYYIEVNFETKEVLFQHKNNPKYQGNLVLRNASETAKIIRQIKELFENDNWAQYFNFEDIEKVRNTTIQKLIQTTISLSKIKMEWK